jgi:hypothetical protein
VVDTPLPKLDRLILFECLAGKASVLGVVDTPLLKLDRLILF